ncbi:MAG: hypothetical protein AUJ92_00535 [Armatimonadetes bacterium CG2_30_59_28]|nr:MAG: hypothetical protein AUJ92_00535 [Armatimonadetes bacterium CG2_30_59_28]PIU65678.1 MAG: hypothetical protein COS85_07870 [Armatimonadetes bacterium CG07_land_8_20_14_0_80_59_28]
MKFPSRLKSCLGGHETHTATFRRLRGFALTIICLALLALIAGMVFSQESRTREEKPQPTDEKAQPKEEKPQTTGEEKPQPKEEEQPREEEPKAREEKPRPREDKPLPKDDFETRAKRDYDRIENPEVTFPHYLELRKQEALRQNQLKKSPQLAYTPVIGQKTPCGNGDFEAGLNPAEWQGAYGLVPANGNPIFSSFTNGIVSGAINLGTSRQTVVGPSGTDPNVGIPLTAPGSTRAVRIGNAVTGAGSELLSKTFTVTAANSLISFWYAVVFQDPGHVLSNQPSFWVRVTVSGNYVPGLVNLGNNSDKVVADGSNVFFQKTTTGLLYKNSTCAQIDLSQQIGKTVTIEFVTEDCTQGGHYGYAYLDNFCGSCAGSPTGSLTFAPSTSSTCGPGQLSRWSKILSHSSRKGSGGLCYLTV